MKDKKLHQFAFPLRFSRADRMLRSKFRRIDFQTIEDSLQYARLEYWQQNIAENISDETEAFNWFLKVARFYLYKELERSKKLCDLRYAMHLFADCDFPDKLIYADLLEVLMRKLPRYKAILLIRHASGYSLRELAESGGMSLQAAKQRHARSSRIIRRNKAYFYH